MSATGGQMPRPEFAHLASGSIAAKRLRLGIPEDWDAEPCANNCGEFVFVPPGVPAMAGMQAACSAECALAIARSRA